MMYDCASSECGINAQKIMFFFFGYAKMYIKGVIIFSRFFEALVDIQRSLYK